jgi:hypothetical protein
MRRKSRGGIPASLWFYAQSFHAQPVEPPKPVMVEIRHYETGDIESTCTLDEFMAANADDDATCRDVWALSPGESVLIGGGAYGAFIVRRVA